MISISIVIETNVADEPQLGFIGGKDFCVVHLRTVRVL